MKHEKRNLCLAFIVMLMIIEIFLGCYMNQHRGIENDEIFSLGLANNTGDFLFFENAQVEEYSNDAGWFDGSRYRDYITVQPNEKFSFKNVFINQGRDNHPPLFYLWVNVVSSFTPDKVNYLGAVFINIISMCGVILLLYLSMKKMLGNRWCTVIPSVLWICSIGCYQLTNYIRMYTLLCLWTCALLYLHICFIKERTVSKRRAIQLGVIVFLGGLTHYYFYVFGFFVALSYLIMQVLQIRKELREKYVILLKYACPYLGGGIMAMIVFPKVLKHIFKSSMSGRMQDNLKGNGLPFNETYDVINQAVFQNKVIWCIAFLIVVVGVVFVLIKGNKFKAEIDEKEDKKEYMQVLTLLVLSIAGFLLIAMKASVYIAWYYISPAFSTILLLVMLICMIGFWYDQEKVSIIACLVLCIFNIYGYCNNTIPVIIQERRDNIAYQNMVDDLADNDCIYLSESWNCLYGNHLPDMAKMDEVRCITPDEFVKTDLQKLLDGRETTEQGLIMICRKVDNQDKYLRQMEGQTSLQGELVWADDKNSFYKFN